jgi:hypothetical protein
MNAHNEVVPKEFTKDGEQKGTIVPYVVLDPEALEYLPWPNHPDNLSLETYFTRTNQT